MDPLHPPSPPGPPGPSGPSGPPGSTEPVYATSVLAVAPHYDDEVLGCGGLLARLAAQGAVVRVLFLSDGGGGVEEVADRESYRRRRREESARAGEVLRLAGSDHLELPDGALDRHVDEICRGLRRALLTQRPELLLVPSPLERSGDHRAAFAALQRLFAPLRPAAEAGEQTGDAAVLAPLRILLYEVNHPAYPDLLVDVSAEGEVLARAMACYESQEERHPYLAAGLGLRSFRTLTLPTPVSGTYGVAVSLVEAYRRLAVADFQTRSYAQLLRHLGGAPERIEIREGPRVSVVVRTVDRPALLAEALASLAAGTYTNAEVVLVNDGGPRPEVPVGFPLPVVRVDLEAGRGRAAAAQAGVEAATGDFVAFLDDDDLAAPEHLAILAGLVSAAGVRVAYTDAAVAVYELDPKTGWTCRKRRLPYSRDFDPDVLLVDNYIPFNTLLIERRLFAEAGPFDGSLPFFEDWDMLLRLAALAPFHHRAEVTCEYRHFRGGGHHVFGERPSERADFVAVKARVLAKHAARRTPEVLARAVDVLRGEVVAEREALAAVRREVVERGRQHAALELAYKVLEGERFAWEERCYAARGEAAAQAGEVERLSADLARVSADLERIWGEEGRLRAVVEDQTAHLGRTYAEIERLNGLLKEVESTRAWRAHQWWHRRFS